MFKSYLGDAVYVELDDCRGVVLTTENGISETNRIVLEPEVVRAFDEWRKATDLEVEIRYGKKGIG